LLRRLTVASRDWVYEKFCSYYRNPGYLFPSLPSFSQREYAFLLFRERAMVRHKAFANTKSLSAFMRERVPSDVYHSCAYYENPDADMDKKGWAGADLVFDIDADHIPTSCGKLHDEWKCSNPACLVSGGLSGRGVTPEECPACGGVKFETKTWACEQCIDTTRVEMRKLLDMLMNDFGFSEHEIHTYFSGHRGYHIHVENEVIRSLDTMARKEIVDYVSGIGLNLIDKRKKKKTDDKDSPDILRLTNFIWGGRLNKGMRQFIKNATVENFREIGVMTNLDALLKDREEVLRRCFDENYWRSVNDVGIGTWLRIAEEVRKREAAQIDTVVTTDVHRLIRANGTLHGKTGLLKVEFPVKELDSFDPFVGAVAFKEGTAKVQVSKAPEFKLNGETFGPYRDEAAELPTAAAVLLILKGRAELQE
jgi:DNA primase small subunit